MREYLLLVAVVSLFLTAGCTKPPDAQKGSVNPPPSIPALTAAERTELSLPLPNALTLATSEDIANATDVPDDVRSVVNRYIEKEHPGVKWEVSAMRDLAGHLLLWLDFPEIIDGGIDIIYSKEQKAVVGTFLGGYRG